MTIPTIAIDAVLIDTTKTVIGISKIGGLFVLLPVSLCDSAAGFPRLPRNLGEQRIARRNRRRRTLAAAAGFVAVLIVATTIKQPVL